MTIGQELTGARHKAGLTVVEVSERTRIRPGLIRDIERDDYGECGGDFYTRGHIRAIATALGVDPAPLIREYDAAHPPGKRLTVADLHRKPAPPAKRQQRGIARAAALATVLLAVIGFASYELVSGLGKAQPIAATAKTGPAVAAAPGRTAASTHPTAGPSASATAPPAAPVKVLTPVSATAFGPDGTASGDDPQDAQLAIDGDSSTFWHTDWYTTAAFGNLQTGTGLLVDMGRPVAVASVVVTLGSTPGADLELRAGSTTVPADLLRVASASNAGGVTLLSPATPVRARYVLIWFTSLPPDAAGTYQANIYNVRVTGTP
jgi:cytoskeletal protein RodZ